MGQNRRSLNMVWESVFYPKEEAKEEEFPVNLPLKKFCTKSEYLGQWRKIGMDGEGQYKFPHEVKYSGQLHDGQFHGKGVLKYPMGQQIQGIWKNGHITKYKFRFSDGLTFGSPWHYCKYPDRRFQISLVHGLLGTPEEHRTNDPKPRLIPPGMYDTVDGFYDPGLKCVVSARDLKKVLRILTSSEEKWTMEHCRKAWDENVGYKPEIYEKWTTGHFLEMSITDTESSLITLPDGSDDYTPV